MAMVLNATFNNMLGCLNKKLSIILLRNYANFMYNYKNSTIICFNWAAYIIKFRCFVVSFFVSFFWGEGKGVGTSFWTFPKLL